MHLRQIHGCYFEQYTRESIRERETEKENIDIGVKKVRKEKIGGSITRGRKET